MQLFPFVTTIAERCRVCYTCVRECPAKAIRIRDGQAEVLPERCICCGNCVKVCSQGAKQILSSIDLANRVLKGETPVAACIAPSFPVEFGDIKPERLVGMLGRLGFDSVVEVAFGADLVADRYRSLVAQDGGGHIATSCPALVEYVCRYEPDLVARLAPIVSPMVATARMLRSLHPLGIRVVFIGPCIAKKREAEDQRVAGDVDAALTFVELREMFKEHRIEPEETEPGEFDPPRAGLGALFPISRGLLQAAGISEDLLTNNIVATDGRRNFVEALKDFHSGELRTGLLEILCCNGCIMGPGMTTGDNLYRRREKVSRFARERLADFDEDAWRRDIARFANLDLSRTYQAHDTRILIDADSGEIQKELARMGKLQPEDELNCGACGYDTCRQHAIAIVKGLAESEMCLPYTIEELRCALDEVAQSHDQLADTRAALMQAEKLASMGQLAAGIAHEVNNPLGVVLLYSHMLLDQVQDPALRDDLKMVAEQADRCKKIVSGLLHFARRNRVLRQSVDVYGLVTHSIGAMRLPSRIETQVVRTTENTSAELDRDQIIQVLTNLGTNAVDAMPDGGRITIEVGGDESHVSLAVSDTGHGIPESRRSKIFEPFFTTKQIGKGTGLGLAVSYGIIKMHKGDISFASNAEPSAGPTGTTFTVTLPRRGGDE
ncbi:MAG: [Fe-Fe] hydrogenase large subunit C-terminal domain-containing protein [Planctomycetota bacterium]